MNDLFVNDYFKTLEVGDDFCYSTLISNEHLLNYTCLLEVELIEINQSEFVKIMKL